MPRADIDWALGEIGADRHKDAKRAREYYEGKHALAFAIERFETVFAKNFLANLKDNLCAAVIDSLTDRLELLGVSSSEAKREIREPEGGGRRRLHVEDPLAARAWSIWGRNDMDQRSTEVYREAFLAGDGYVLVWPDPAGRAAIWVRTADEMAVRYSEETPGQLEVAARRWKDRDGRTRLNLLYADHVEQYATPAGTRQPIAGPARRLARALGISTTSGSAARYDSVGEVENPHGRVPVFHFPNKRLYDYGIGELGDVLPLQDGLNKAVCDLFVDMEYAAFPQRWATGMDVEVDESTEKPKNPPFTPGRERMWAWPESEAQFGQFEASDLRQFLEAQESLRAEIARVSGIPLHYLYIAKGDYPSGEAMKSAEARFSKKVRDRQTSFGNVWQKALAFALRVEEVELADGFELTSKWVSPTPRSEEEEMRTLTMKKALGVPRSQLLAEAGYTDEQIDLMLEEDPMPPESDEQPPPPSPIDGDE